MRTLLLGTSILALAACADGTRPTFQGEAGLVTQGDFGNATMNNVLLMSGQMPYAVQLSSRFAAEVPTTITFAFDSAALDATARAALDRQAQFILAFPEVRFAVYGHTDLVGSAGYNYDLGLRRARAAVAYLVSRGVDANRLEALVSEGETQPLIASQGPERANRRTVTDVRGFVQGHPNVLNGKYAAVIFREYVESATAPQGVAEVESQELTTGG